MEDEALELRLNGETRQTMLSSVQEEQSALSRQITQLQLTLQEKDTHIQCVHLSLCSLPPYSIAKHSEHTTFRKYVFSVNNVCCYIPLRHC